MPELTVITTTYNRAECLMECWESLRHQTCADFQWLIIDDGSTDDTYEKVKVIQEENPNIIIDYVYKTNGGKHTALNKSHDYIKGKYVVILDSDDRFTPDAVEMILTAWRKYEKQTEVGQVILLKGYTENDPICYVAHDNIPVDTITEPRIGKTGRDCCDTFRTELFIKYPFPEFEGERFLGEGAWFFFIELVSKGVYINKVIYLCNYREDGLTKAGREMRIKNPLGGRYNSKVYMDRHLPLKIRIKKSILYVCYSKFAKMGMVQNLRETKYKVLVLITYVPGVALYYFWKRKYLSCGENNEKV